MSFFSSVLNMISGLGRSFFRWFIVISLIPLILVSFISYEVVRESLVRNTSESLLSTVELKQKYIETFFDEKMKDLSLQANLRENIQFLVELRQTNHNLGLVGKEFVRHPQWARVSEKYSHDLELFGELNNYQDVLLINSDGTIFYTITNMYDLGNNVFSDSLAETFFSKACQRALLTDKMQFSDLEKYSSGGHQLDSFLVSPVHNETGETIGLIALEISLEQIDQMMSDRTGMGETGETFLVGSDLLMRSDSWKESERTALVTRVDSDPVREWFEFEVNSDETSPLFHELKVHNYQNHRGTRVFGAIANLESLDRYGVHWILVQEVAESESLALVADLRRVSFYLLLGTCLLVISISILVTRSIVSPIQMLSDWSRRVAKGELSSVKSRFPDNEIGELYQSFSKMVRSFQEVTTVCEAVSVGDFSKTLELRGRKDTLGAAVNQMAENLRAAAHHADIVAEGDFTAQITPWSENDRLGNALYRMTSRLREMAEANRNALEDARRLTEYLDKLPIPVLCMDPHFRIIYINKAGAALAGFDQESCIGRYCYEFYTNSHCRTKNCRVGMAMRTRQIEEAETLVDPSGLNLPIRYTGAPVIGDNGEVIGALEYIVDISESKKAFTAIETENWIQESVSVVNDRLRGDQNLHQLCENLLSGIAQRLPVMAAAIYLMDDEKLELGGTYSTSGDNAARESFSIDEGLVGQAAFEKRTLVVDDIPDGAVRMVSGTLDVTPHQLVMIPLLYDDEVKGCLELATLEKFNEESLNFLERVAGNIAIAINSVQARMKMSELLDETQRQAEELQVQQEELQATNEELESQTLSLKEREVELQTQHDELMALNEELEEKTDFLQRQKADIEHKNEELEQARTSIERKAEQLTLASKYKSEFMANMSHELRTPLNSLLLLSHNLAENKEGNLNEDQVESANVMYSSGNDLLELINEILDLSKIEAGRVDVARRDVSLNDLADRLQANFQPVIDDKDLYFSVDIDPLSPAAITTDRQRLEQVLRNLLSNAIKFTEEGGVTLTIRPLNDQDEPTISGLSPEEILVIAVSDTGIGIPAEKQQIIFEAFQQVDGSTSRKYGGTGLGLSISRELTELLGGEIQVNSSTGRGTTFTVFLPRVLEQPEIPKKSQTQPIPRVERRSPAGDSTNKTQAQSKHAPVVISDDRRNIEKEDKTILIIEDDPHFAKYLVKQSNEKGFKCLVSAEGGDGLLLAEEYHPKAIILDINLPDMNGWEVLDSLKKNQLLRHIPVHMISADEKTLDAFKKGAVGYLHKPVSQDEIRNAFERFEDFIDNDIRDLLVVEDDEILRQEIVKLIGNGDVRTTAVATGMEVVEVLREQRFDCMILDIGLPDMTGFELLDLLERESDMEIPPVIIYTGRELTREEHDKLYRYTDSIIIKGVKSVERLLDETALFLHRIVDNMPTEKRKMIANLYEQDAMFIGKKILVVDDDMRNAFALSKILLEKEMEVLIANTGFKALEMLETEEKVDLVLMDIMMPEMDGYEAMKKIRDQERFWNLPIIALTAKAMPEDKRKCMEAGANDYLAKPIEEARLFSVMRIWLYR